MDDLAEECTPLHDAVLLASKFKFYGKAEHSAAL